MKFISRWPQWGTWGLAFPLLVINSWLLIVVFNYFENIITVFIASNLIAFILNYLVEFFTRSRMKREQAVLIVFIATFFTILILALTLAPIIIEQFNDLANRLPSWIDSGSKQTQSLNEWAIAHKFPLDVGKMAVQLRERITSQLQSFTGQLVGFLLGTVGSFFNLLLTLVISFYLLVHGQKLWDGVEEWLPHPLVKEIRYSLRQNFHNYYVGQASLAAIIGGVMIVTFSLLGVPFGLLFGLAVGIMALFPFGAGLSILVVSLLMALNSFWLGVQVLLVATFIEQIIENIIAPRLLGGFTGLNPVWVLLSLLVGAKIGGILGILIAVPMAGFIKSLAQMMRENMAMKSS